MAKDTPSTIRVENRAGTQKPNSGKRRTGKRITNDEYNALLTQARDLQWVGQHARAIEVCTQALDAIGKGNSRTAQVQMDLLDTRIESYWASIKPVAMKRDAKLMMQIANAAPSSSKRKKLILKAQALNWKAKIQGLIDNKIELARKTFASAIKNAQQSQDKYLEAESLYLLGRFQTGEHGIRTSQQAVDLFKSLDDQRGFAKALTGLAWEQAITGQTEEARKNAQVALSISDQIGFNFAKCNALNVLSIMEFDIGQALTLLKQSYQAAEASGDMVLVVGRVNNLGVRYSNLGLYPRTLRYFKKSLAIIPLDSRDYGYVPLSNIIHIEIEQENLDQAREYLTELRSMKQDASSKAFTEELAGRIALLEGRYKEAIKCVNNAIRIYRESELTQEIGEFALLGEAYLADGNPTAALKATTRAVKMHRELDFPRIEDHPSQNIWWRHALALRANKKNNQADEALEMAYDFLLQGIASLRDDGLRRNYLNKVRINCEILQAWVKKSQKRKGGRPSAPAMPHLEVESSLREPFERLAEISLELNALHTVEEIQTFLVEEATEISGGERVLLILEKDGELDLADSYVPIGEDAKKSFSAAKKYLEKARISRTVQLLVPKRKGRSQIVAPLIAQNQVIGYLYTDMDSLYGMFDKTDRDMLGMLANQGAVALDNAGLVEGTRAQSRRENRRTSNIQCKSRTAQC